MTVTTGDAVIVVKDLRKTYGARVAVDDVSFEVRRGQIFGLLGSNGAGKTTTVECLEGLRRQDSGAAHVLGIDVAAHPARLRDRIGCQLQDSRLPDRLKVWEALRLFAAAARRPIDWEPLLDAWDLAGIRNDAFGSLSGGQRQRLLVALAVVNGPRRCLPRRDDHRPGPGGAARHVGSGRARSAITARRSCSSRTSWTRPSGSATAWL